MHEFKFWMLILGIITTSARVGYGDLVTAPDNMSLVSLNAINGVPSPAFDLITGFDGIPLDFSGVDHIDALLLYDFVGSKSDNGFEEFSTDVYSGSSGTGSVLQSLSFPAALNLANTSESFSLTSTIANPGSFVQSATSAYATAARAEFSEVQFDQTVTAVPDPSSVTLVLLTGAACCLRRQRRRRI